MRRRRSEERTDREPARGGDSADAPSPKAQNTVASLRGSPPDRFVTAYVAGDGSLTTVRRTRSGERILRKEAAEWVSFLRAADAKPEVRSLLRDSRFVVGIRDEGPWVRVRWSDPRVRARCSAPDGWFAARGVPTYEADVDPVRRWLTDGEMGIARPRRVYLDLEADSRIASTRKEAARMLAWSLFDPETKTGRHAVLEEDSDAAERRLIVSLWEALEAYDQVCAWAGNFFDEPFLDARTKRRGLRPEKRNWLWLDHMELYRRMNSAAAESGDEKQSYSLNAVARSLGLGGKLEGVDRAKSWDEWVNDPDRLGRYCARDTEMMHEIEQETGYIELLQTLAESSFVFPDSRAIGPQVRVESFLLRLARERGMRFPTHHYVDDEDEGGEEEEGFKGAFNMEPERGILRDVHVCDFSRLYPSVILSWNMSPDTYRPDVVLRESAVGRPSYLAHVPLQEYPRPADVCQAPLTDRCFALQPDGLLPIAIAEMLRLRKEWDVKKSAAVPGTAEWKDADRRSSAYKIAANACYGVLGLKFSRIYVREVAEAVTQAGVWLIQQTIEAATRAGLRVVYAATDSAFVTGCDRRTFEAFVATCNAELYPRLLAEKGTTRNHISLAYEKAFAKVILLRKNRYCGRYSHWKGKAATADSKPEIKGLEYKSGASVRLARELQREAVDMLLGCGGVAESEDPNDYERLVEQYKARVLGDVLTREDVSLSKKLAKPVSQYVRKKLKSGEHAAQPIHVEVARVLQERGADVGKGRVIEYVVVDGEATPMRAIPSTDFDGVCDRFWLWESMVYPPTQRLLEAAFPSYSWATHEKVRPAKPRVESAKMKAAKAQASLFVTK